MMLNKVCGNIIIEPSGELVPSIHIPPMTNAILDCEDPNEEQIWNCEEYLATRFGTYYIVPKARTAIQIALEYYHLKKDDVVTILTTSGNFYISSCVTKEIEKVCQWNREITDKTKVIFVNHEFGYPYKNLCDLKKYNLPVIEDCAYAFFTEEEQLGKVGDFVVYSLPKAFPMQMGGVLKSNVGEIVVAEDADVRGYVLQRLASQIPNIEEIKKKRLENWKFLANGLVKLGVKPWSLENGIVPGVMLFEWDDDIDYPALKEFMQYHGVESSVFYGKNAFFIPTHHLLSQDELNYMVSLLTIYKKKGNV